MDKKAKHTTQEATESASSAAENTGMSAADVAKEKLKEEGFMARAMGQVRMFFKQFMSMCPDKEVWVEEGYSIEVTVATTRIMREYQSMIFDTMARFLTEEFVASKDENGDFAGIDMFRAAPLISKIIFEEFPDVINACCKITGPGGVEEFHLDDLPHNIFPSVVSKWVRVNLEPKLIEPWINMAQMVWDCLITKQTKD